MYYSQNRYVAALYIVVAGLMFAFMGACIKLVSDEVANEWIVFYRNLFGLFLLIPFIFQFGLNNLKTKIIHWHLLRSIMGLGAMYCFFYSLANIPLAEAVLLSYTTPLFAPIIAVFLLGEKMTLRLSVALLVGFFGVFFMVSPDLEGFSPVSLIALLSGILAAIAMTAIRRMARSEPTTRIVFYYSIICTLLSSIPLFYVESLPSLYSIAILSVIGMLATLGQLALTQGYSKASVAQVGPFTYCTVIFAIILGGLFWQEKPDMFASFGIVLVITAGSIALTQSGKKAQQRKDGE